MLYFVLNTFYLHCCLNYCMQNFHAFSTLNLGTSLILGQYDGTTLIMCRYGLVTCLTMDQYGYGPS